MPQKCQIKLKPKMVFNKPTELQSIFNMGNFMLSKCNDSTEVELTRRWLPTQKCPLIIVESALVE